MANSMKLGTGKTVQAVAESAELGDESLAILAGSDSPKSFVETLVDGLLLTEAVSFLAHALPPRTGVYWAWWCARESVGADAPEDVLRCLAAMKVWIAQPADETRRAAFDAGNEVGFDTPAGAVGAAVYFSGGSIAPPELEDTPPPEHACAKAIFAAVTMSALRDVEDPSERFSSFLGEGMNVAEKSGLWAPGED